ncbi:oxidoreductase [Kocuria sp.]|uniref:oxidoreductase n=1 Tax=Kocuria sp. TaxID=1871328 RepID=UPI0026DC5CE0|nr:oxidoreductase [Kocuria sp.]MDO4918800.1 oxidoreductase [Kocuria sp.]
MTPQDQQPLHSGFDATTDADGVLDGVDLHGKVVLVTGGSSGLGAETVAALARAGASVIAPVRSAGSVTPAEGVREVPGLDLGDLGAVAATAETVRGMTEHLDAVIAAAGIMATPLQRIGPGWESQFTVNHLGHFALLTRLYPLLAARGARVVTYSSAGHHLSDVHWEDLHFLRGYDKWQAYGQSKTATSLLAVGLDRRGREDGVRAFAVHPGGILTGLQRHLPREEQVALGWVDEHGEIAAEGFKSPSQGAATGLWAATSPQLEGRGGLYLEDCDVARVATGGRAVDGGVAPYAVDPNAAEQLWRLSAAMTASDLPA